LFSGIGKPDATELAHLYETPIPAGRAPSRIYTASGAILRPFVEDKMFDVLMLALGLGFLAAAAAYVFACNRL
jgi:hypothetical protein